MKKIILPGFIFFFSTVSLTILKGQALVNDDCQFSINVGAGCTTPTTATTINATASPFSSSCKGDTDDDIWYNFTPTSSSITISISNAVLETLGTADIGMEIINGPCVDPSSVFCDNDIASGNGDQVINDLTPGSKYSIRFWTTGTGVGATFDFCVQDNGALPVKLSAYKVICVNGYGNIQWTTTSEINNHFFTVERSKDGAHFETLSVINVVSNNTGGNSYSVTDPHPFQNETYYRLKQTDLDGRETYFKILALSCEGNKPIIVSPNPVLNKLLLNLSNNLKPVKIKILTASGNVINKIESPTMQGNAISIDVGNLAPGLYFLQITTENGEQQVVKFLKQ